MQYPSRSGPLRSFDAACSLDELEKEARRIGFDANAFLQNGCLASFPRARSCSTNMEGGLEGQIICNAIPLFLTWHLVAEWY